MQTLFFLTKEGDELPLDYLMKLAQENQLTDPIYHGHSFLFETEDGKEYFGQVLTDDKKSLPVIRVIFRHAPIFAPADWDVFFQTRFKKECLEKGTKKDSYRIYTSLFELKKIRKEK